MIHPIFDSTRTREEPIVKEKSTRERALSLIDLAHPKFREELLAEAQKMTLI